MPKPKEANGSKSQSNANRTVEFRGYAQLLPTEEQIQYVRENHLTSIDLLGYIQKLAQHGYKVSFSMKPPSEAEGDDEWTAVAYGMDTTFLKSDGCALSAKAPVLSDCIHLLWLKMEACSFDISPYVGFKSWQTQQYR
jgi:hypothetical protein